MPLTKQQKVLRRSWLGSSDMAAILGLDPFRNAGDVFLEKTGKLDEQAETDVMKRGHYIEPAILNYAEAELGPLNRNVFFKVKDLPLGSNVDAEVIETGLPVEAKSVGAFAKEVWGESGTDEIPDRVIIQSHVHLICTSKELCHVPVYLPYREFQMFGVHLDTEIKDVICEKAVDFWENHVQKDIPPDNVPSLDVVKRIRRMPATVVDIPQTLVENWNEAKESLKIAEATKDEATATLIAALGTAEAGNTPIGQVTYLEQTRRGIDAKRLRLECPDVADEYAKISRYRVARFKKAK